MFNDDELDDLSVDEGQSSSNVKKKVMLIVIPAIVLIGFGIALYRALNQNINSKETVYSVVEEAPAEDARPPLVLYDLPEIVVSLKDVNVEDKKNHQLFLKLTLEFESQESIQRVEALMPRIIDAVIVVGSEMTNDDVSGARGMYWLKEEILHRLNLILDPIHVKNTSFRGYDVKSFVESSSVRINKDISGEM